MTGSLMDAKVLRRAAELVEMGHCKGEFAQDQAGCGVEPTVLQAVRWCAMGAIKAATFQLGLPSGHRDVAKKALRQHLKKLAGSLDDPAPYISTFNDAPERTADEVAAALRGAADQVDAAHA